MSNILVIGSLAYDSIFTPSGSAERTLGGSANYFSLASSFYAPVRVVGVVGSDYSDGDMQMLRERKVDVSGIQVLKGKTFHWAGEYKTDLNEAVTLSTELNVFEHFNPQLPANFRSSEYVFLANIDPVLQHQVLEQVQSPKLVGADTMNFWINSKLDNLKALLGKIDVLLINEGEAKLLTKSPNAIAAAKIIAKMGPKAIVIKRGEYGFVLFTENQYFMLPAFPIAEVVDPTGAGDTFAGGFFGYLAKNGGTTKIQDLKQACIHGSLMASFTVEGFGVTRLKTLTQDQVSARSVEYKKCVDLSL